MNSTNLSTGIRIGDRVERILGTSIEGLIGEVRDIHPSLDGQRLIALVRLEGPGEPGIGHQFACDVDHLALAQDGEVV